MSEVVNNTTANESAKVETKSAETAAYTPEQIANLKAIAKKYEAVNGLYQSNDEVKKAINRALGYEVAEEKKTQATTEEVEELDARELAKRYRELEARLNKAEKSVEATSKDLADTKDVWSLEYVTANSVNVDNRYKDQVRKYADNVGMSLDSKQFKIAYAQVVDNAKNLCKKYNLVDNEGNPNPLKSYTPDLIKEAFHLTLGDLKEAFGFDALEAKQRRLLDDSKRERNMEQERLDKAFKELSLKGLNPTQARARLLEDEFNKKLRGLGMTRQEAFEELRRG